MGSTLLVLVAVACISVGNVLGQSAGNKFSPAQESFLRKLLKEEAKGLRAGMMAAFSTPKGKTRIESNLVDGARFCLIKPGEQFSAEMGREYNAHLSCLRG